MEILTITQLGYEYILLLLTSLFIFIKSFKTFKHSCVHRMDRETLISVAFMVFSFIQSIEAINYLFQVEWVIVNSDLFYGKMVLARSVFTLLMGWLTLDNICCYVKTRAKLHYK